MSGTTHVCSSPSLSMVVEPGYRPRSCFECCFVFSFGPGFILGAPICCLISALWSLSFGRLKSVDSVILHFLHVLITWAWSSSSSASTFAVSGFRRPFLARTHVAISVTRVVGIGDGVLVSKMTHSSFSRPSSVHCSVSLMASADIFWRAQMSAPVMSRLDSPKLVVETIRFLIMGSEVWWCSFLLPRPRARISASIVLVMHYGRGCVDVAAFFPGSCMAPRCSQAAVVRRCRPAFTSPLDRLSRLPDVVAPEFLVFMIHLCVSAEAWIAKY